MSEEVKSNKSLKKKLVLIIVLTLVGLVVTWRVVATIYTQPAELADGAKSAHEWQMKYAPQKNELLNEKGD